MVYLILKGKKQTFLLAWKRMEERGMEGRGGEQLQVRSL